MDKQNKCLNILKRRSVYYVHARMWYNLLRVDNKRMVSMKKKILILLGISLVLTGLSVVTKHVVTKIKYDDASIYPDIHLESIMENYENIKKAVFYPSFKDDVLNEVIAEYVNNEISLFDEETLDFNEDFELYLYINFEIVDNHNEIYFIVFNQTSYTGGANPSNQVRVFTVDLKESQLLSPLDFLKKDFDQGILLRLLNEAFNQSQYRDFLFEDVLKEWVSTLENQQPNLYFENEDMVFLFNEYEVSARAAGQPVIKLPIASVSTLLSEQWLGHLKQHNTKLEGIIQKPLDYQEKRIAITFDDGPHPRLTYELLDLLDQYEAKATFFVLGNRVKFYPNIVQEIAKRKHELGNHSYSHRSFTSLNFEDILHEIGTTSDLIKEASGQYPTLLRPPYGSYNDLVKEATHLPIVLWNIDSLDWKIKSPDVIAQHVLQDAGPNKIILMHDIHKQSIDAVKIILETLTQEGYKFVTISDILY